MWMSLISKEHTFYSLDLIYAYDDSKFCNWNLRYLTLKCTVYQYISEVLKRGSDHTGLNIGLAFYAQVFEISKSNIMVLLGAELTLSKVIIN